MRLALLFRSSARLAVPLLLETTVGVPLGQTMVIGTAPAPQNARRGEAGTPILTVRPELAGSTDRT